MMSDEWGTPGPWNEWDTDVIAGPMDRGVGVASVSWHADAKLIAISRNFLWSLRPEVACPECQTPGYVFQSECGTCHGKGMVKDPNGPSPSELVERVCGVLRAADDPGAYFCATFEDCTLNHALGDLHIPEEPPIPQPSDTRVPVELR